MINLKSIQRAFTLVELLVVMVIIGILVTLTFPLYHTVRENSERVICAGNLRSLFVSFNTYVQDRQHWPQVPEKLLEKAEEDEGAEEQYWLDALKGYGAPEKVWLCPTLKRMHEKDPTKFSRNPKIHYLPTLFDENPYTPFKWSTMPWLIEIGDFHDGGHLLIFSDGTVRAIGDVLAEHKAASDAAASKETTIEVSIFATVATARETPSPGIFTISRTGPTKSPLQVTYTLTGNATNGEDYNSLSESVTIPANSRSVMLTVLPLTDSVAEGDETVVATLMTASPGQIGPNFKATVTIQEKGN